MCGSSVRTVTSQPAYSRLAIQTTGSRQGLGIVGESVAPCPECISSDGARFGVVGNDNDAATGRPISLSSTQAEALAPSYCGFSSVRMKQIPRIPSQPADADEQTVVEPDGTKTVQS